MTNNRNKATFVKYIFDWGFCMIQVRNLVKSFGSLDVLKGIDLEVNEKKLSF